MLRYLQDWSEILNFIVEYFASIIDLTWEQMNLWAHNNRDERHSLFASLRRKHWQVHFFLSFRISLVIVYFIHRVVSFHSHSLTQHKRRYEGITACREQWNQMTGLYKIFSYRNAAPRFYITGMRQICFIFHFSFMSDEEHILRSIVSGTFF
jgi:hypothetical protein